MDPRDGSGNTVYTTGGPPARGIYKSTDGGMNWQLIQSGLPNIPFAILDLDYTLSGNNLVLFAGLVSGQDTSVNGIWRSTDGGVTWQHLPIQLVDLASGQSLPLSAIGFINLAADRTLGTANGVCGDHQQHDQSSDERVQAGQ
ncbi:MAG: WD40/YVTN/BNR-like repeat-containing protein [Ktedonobacteraceae bacterium]